MAGVRRVDSPAKNVSSVAVTEPGSHGAVKLERTHDTSSSHSGAWPLHSWLTSSSSWLFPGLRQTSSCTSPSELWFGTRQGPHCPKFPLGLFPESNGLTISTTEFTHRDRRRQLFLDGQSKLAWLTGSRAVIIRSGVWDTEAHQRSR